MGHNHSHGSAGHTHAHGNAGHAKEHSHSHSHSLSRSTGGEKQNINVRAAFIHVLGDLVQSVGVLIAAYIIKFKVCVVYVYALFMFMCCLCHDSVLNAAINTVAMCRAQHE